MFSRFIRRQASQVGFTGATTEQWKVTFGSQTFLSTLQNDPEQAFQPWTKQTMQFTASATSQLLTFLSQAARMGLPPLFSWTVSRWTLRSPSTLMYAGLGCSFLIVAWRVRNSAPDRSLPWTSSAILQPPLLAFAIDFLRLCLWLLVLMIVFVPLEKHSALHPQKLFRKAFLTDVAYCFLSGLLPKLLLVPPLAIVAWVVTFSSSRRVHSQVAALPLWIRFPAAMIVGEIGFYWGHRWSHEFRSYALPCDPSQRRGMDWLVNTRAHPVDLVFTRLCGLIPIYVLGLSQPTASECGLVSVLVILTGTFWCFFIHANLKWRFGPLAWLVATPSFHHWHHTYEEPRNKNYAPILPWIDAIFGTYHMPRTEWPSKYGIDAALPCAMVAQVLNL